MMIPVVPRRRSRTPGSLPNNGPSRFKRMKARLRMKVRSPDEPVDPQLEDDMEDIPHPHQDDAPPPQTDKQVLENEGVEEENKNNSGNFNRASPMKIFRVCKSFTTDQCAVISDANLGDILVWKVSKLIPDLCKFLMGCFNPQTCELDFGARGRVPTDLHSVVRVLGVPMGNTPISYYMDPKATRTMLDMFGVNNAKQPSLAWLERELGPNHPPDQIFLRKFCIYLSCAVFAPTTATGISPRCYPSLVNTEGIRNLNWPKFILDMMIQTARAKEKKNWFKACMPYLMVRYVDSLETDEIHVPEDGTRICVWTNKLVRLVVEMDTNSDGSFGKLPLKACFRMKMTLFSAGPSVLDLFIKNHVSGDITEDELANYRVALTEMCTSFEDGLAQFLKNLSNKDSKAPVEENHHEVHRHSKRTIPRRSRRNRKTEGLNGDGNDGTDMGVNTTTDEIVVPASLQKRSREMDQIDETLATVSGSSKRHKSDQCQQQPEPVEHNDKDLHHKMDELSADGNVSDVDLEIATGHAAANPTSLSNVANRDGIAIPIVEALKHLQIYGTGSQSSADSGRGGAMKSDISPGTVAAPPSTSARDGVNSEEHLKSASKEAVEGNVSYVVSMEQQNSSMCQTSKTSAEAIIQPGEPKCSPATSKRVTCLSAQDSPSPTRRRPVTRSMSPLKPPSPGMKDSPNWDVGTSGIPKKSPQRRTRFATAKVRAGRNMDNLFPKTVDVQQGQPSPPLMKDSTSRKLDLEFGTTDPVSETEEQRRRRELIEDCPTFDLGLDDSPDPAVANEQVAAHEEEIVVISSHEESGDSLDKIYATIPMPTETRIVDKGQRLQESTLSPSAPNSYTPVPQAHQKRLVKTAANQKSPYMQGGKKVVPSKSTLEVYNKLCSYGGRTKHDLNKEKIIDDGVWFIYVKDLADSVRPTGWLSNSACELALHVLSKEMAKHKKLVMPLSIATKLRSMTCIFDRAILRAFEFSSRNRLDHKDMIMFSVLQDLDLGKETSRQKSKDKVFIGHYYLIVLNLKAERFEVMDSMRKKGTPSLMKDAVPIIGAIKHMWGLKYSESKISIARWKTEFIETPMQKTSDDCGYFMLLFIEYWDGRRLLPGFTHADLPNMRKLLMRRWLDCQGNLIAWHDLLFPN